MPVGSRIRSNNAFGTITDNPLIAGATAFNSVELALLPQVVGDHAVITFDPLRTNGEPEIVVVTAHGAGAQSATIQRGQYGTVARQHPEGTVWVHAPINEDVIIVTTSTNRPTNPYEGQFIYETDTTRLVGRIAGTWQGLIPPGVISAFGGAVAPTGWLLCNGAAVSRTTFADLFTAVGVAYGPGDGATTFNLPDLRDRVPVGAGATFPTLGATGGSATSTATHTHDLANHTHTLASHTHTLSSHTHTTGNHDHGIFDPGHVHGGTTGGITADHSHNPSGAGAGDWAIRFAGSSEGLTTNSNATRVTFTTMLGVTANHGHPFTTGAGFTGQNLTGGSGNLVSGGPSNNTSGGPSNNTSGTPSNNTSGASSVGAANGNMPPFQVVGGHIIKY